MSCQRGFTLLEALVAVALLTMLGLAAALTLNSSVVSEKIVTGNMDALQQLQRAQQLLRRDLEQMVYRQGRTEQGDSRDGALLANGDPSNDRDGLWLDFYKAGRRILSLNPPTTLLERVRYRVQAGRLIRESSPYLDAPDDDRWFSAVIVPELEQVSVRFFHQERWIEQWPPLNQSTDGEVARLPQALAVTLTTPRFGEVEQLVLLPESGL